MDAKVIRDRNAGNSGNTYWKRTGREFCIRIGADYVRDRAGRVRRFASADAAKKVLTTIATSTQPGA